MRRINDDCAKHHKASLNEFTAKYWDDPVLLRDRVFLARDKDKYDSADGNWYRTEHGDLLFSAVIAKYFMQPTGHKALLRVVDAATILSIKESIRKLQTPEQCIAVHMRHGDSCGKTDGYTHGHTRKCPTFEEYMGKARKMQSQYGVNHVFLATDDVVTDAMVEYAHSLNFTLSYQRIDRSVYNQVHGDVIPNVENLQTENPGQLAHQVYIDLYASLQCNMFIGPQHSTMDMLIYETAVGFKGYYPPFISTDDPWCPVSGNNFCPASNPGGRGIDV